MIRRAILIAAFLVMPSMAQAYSFTCNQVVAAANAGLLTQGAVVGYAWGAADVLAGLLCFVNSPRCGCLSNIVAQRNEEFARAFANQIIDCRNRNGNDPAFGPAMRAAQSVCR